MSQPKPTKEQEEAMNNPAAETAGYQISQKA